MALTEQQRERLRSWRANLIRCEHGVTADLNLDRGCAGTVGHCRCCAQPFCYVGSGCEWPDGSSEATIWTPTDLCSKCGGKHVTTYMQA